MIVVYLRTTLEGGKDNFIS